MIAGLKFGATLVGAAFFTPAVRLPEGPAGTPSVGRRASDRLSLSSAAQPRVQLASTYPETRYTQ